MDKIKDCVREAIRRSDNATPEFIDAVEEVTQTLYETHTASFAELEDDSSEEEDDSSSDDDLMAHNTKQSTNTSCGPSSSINPLYIPLSKRDPICKIPDSLCEQAKQLIHLSQSEHQTDSDAATFLPSEAIRDTHKNITNSESDISICKHEAFYSSCFGDMTSNSSEIRENLTMFDQGKLGKLDSTECQRTFEVLSQSKEYAYMLSHRKQLPVFRVQSQILQTVNGNAASIICGATGCGKTTQVPQMILDDYIERGKVNDCFIIVTQPRRIAATSVAERVAEERCTTLQHEPRWSVSPIDQSNLSGPQYTAPVEQLHKSLPGVGYHIRLQRRSTNNARIMFCTTGILLRWLESNPDLKGISHVIIDEVHERSLETDLLLIVLRNLLLRQHRSHQLATQKDTDKRKMPVSNRNMNPHVVLMSATVNASKFSSYFNSSNIPCPILHVPAGGFPVVTLYLEDTLNLLCGHTKAKSSFTTTKYLRRTGRAVFEEEMAARHNATECARKLVQTCYNHNANSIAEHMTQCYHTDSETLQSNCEVCTLIHTCEQVLPSNIRDEWQRICFFALQEFRVRNHASGLKRQDASAHTENTGDARDAPCATAENGGIAMTTMKDAAPAITDNCAVSMTTESSDAFASQETQNNTVPSDSNDEDESNDNKAVDCCIGPYSADLVEAVFDWEIKPSKFGVHLPVIIKLLETLQASPEDVTEGIYCNSVQTRSVTPVEPQKMAKSDIQLSLSSGSILVFLPGWGDIRRLRDQLLHHPVFGNTTSSSKEKFRILTCHGGFSTQQQSAIFSKSEPGTRDIILATNVAETSITIESVSVVVDAGLVKQMHYSPQTKASTLLPTLIARSNAKQRRGRAGRVSLGVCFHLFSRSRLAIDMEEFPKPEILRVPLENVCLQVKAMGLTNTIPIEDFLAQALDPPNLRTVHIAVRKLCSLGMLSRVIQNNYETMESRPNNAITIEKLTHLGKSVASWPLDPAFGKVLVCGSILDVAFEVALAVAVLSFKSPFKMAMEKHETNLIASSKQKLACNTRSSLFAAMNALCGYQAKSRKNRSSKQPLDILDEIEQSGDISTNLESQNVFGPDSELGDNMEEIKKSSESSISNQGDSGAKSHQRTKDPGLKYAFDHWLNVEACNQLWDFQTQIYRCVVPTIGHFNIPSQSKLLQRWPLIMTAICCGVGLGNIGKFEVIGQRKQRIRTRIVQSNRDLSNAKHMECSIVPHDGLHGVPPHVAKAFQTFQYFERSETAKGQLTLSGCSLVPPVIVGMCGGLLDTTIQVQPTYPETDLFHRSASITYDRKRRGFHLHGDFPLSLQSDRATYEILLILRKYLSEEIAKFSADNQEDKDTHRRTIRRFMLELIEQSWSDCFTLSEGNKIFQKSNSSRKNQKAMTITAEDNNTPKRQPKYLQSGTVMLEDGTKILFGSSKKNRKRTNKKHGR